MRKQQQIWQKEHEEGELIPSETKKSSSSEPSSYVVKLVAFLRESGIPLRGNVVDIGAGKGRNTIYLAKQGFDLYALDYIQSAIDHISSVSKQEKLSTIHAICAPIDEPWPFPNNFFDFAIDCFSSIDIETIKGREVYRNEMFRTLKQGGYALVVVVASDDAFESQMIRQHPGSEKNSSIWPKTGKFQKNYDEDDLRAFYSSFEIIRLEKLTKNAHKMGRDFIATNYWLLLRKK